ncbi:D-alanyl-D-alanine carboxypeptidase/D-alanyl-D-alanine endopeptidase [Streptomonospora nanhaiensis]|uniref:D-alanyl-D-alanine carboxypeptidase/D-alanyl-D-alanine endopeptidase n=1 Tax=Streptomonospora nanhaiensis TaxID=1323731 RepID=UPI001C38E672|nr:D-alanyl-D-alanine carboxypeptidase/D-alanyl-D-alanine-endopeptidase [Streptomonospora nanhaiensis]MBV2365842.1 D-alanyl-D-alanine carboxypeptidase/D-alanyl-D-alanine-endopeptidase [Streptomonospora nanhaiensis]
MSIRNPPYPVRAAAPRRARGAARLGSAAVAVTAAAAIAAAGAAPAAADTATGVADLRADLAALLADPALEGATSGVIVTSLTRGDVLYRSEPRTQVVPASNAKLLTSAAALEVLGADYRFTTSVAAGEDPGDGVVDGDLYLVGTGDPTLTPEAVDQLAAEVAASGVTEVTGDLLADDTWFDSERYLPEWDPTDAPYYYAAQISALTVAANTDYDTGVVNVDAQAGGAAGDPVDVALEPMTDNLSLDNRAETGASGSTSTFGVSRADGTNAFTADGALPVEQTYSTLRTVHEPTDHAAHLFAAALAEHGVKVSGEVGRGAAPESADPVAERSSMPLSELLTPFMKLSNNPHAEILMKAMGREESGEGTWAAGIDAATEALEDMGVNTRKVELVDGSGLSHSDRVTAQAVMDVLEEARVEPWFGVWRDSLPLAGHPDRLVGGTLTSRMRDTPAEGNVQAKTGSLTGASALSGYVTAAGGEELAFTVINNGYAGAAPRGVQDAIAVRLAEFTRDRTADVVRPLAAERTSPSAPDADLECTWAGTC